MSYKTFVSMNIAIIGTGKTAEAYAASYAVAGHEIFLASRHGLKPAGRSALEAFDNIVQCSIEEAAKEADIILISAEPKEIREIAYWLGDVRKKVIIDASANMLTGSDEQVNTAGAIKAITGSPYIVKVFSTKDYRQILKPYFKSDEIKWIMAGDCKKAKEATKILATDLGVSSFIDLGESESIPLFDELTKNWRKQAIEKSNQ